MKYLIKNGTVCFEDGLRKSDILIEDGKFISFENANSENFIDAAGCYILPGMIDIHTHLDDKIGNCYLADTYKTGSEVAVRNGITTIFSFVTQQLNDSLANALNIAINKAKGNSYCDYMWHLTPVSFVETDWKYIFDLIEKGFKTFKFYTTYKSAGLYCDYDMLNIIFTKLENYKVTILIHCEDNDIIESANTNIDLKNSFSHTLLRPKEAEITAINKILNLSGKYKIKIHIVHVSTCEAAEILNNVKDKIATTCETAPHYLNLTDDYLKRDDGFKLICTPPLRNKLNVKDMKEKALDEYFDIYASDHCAFLKKDKNNSESKNDVRLVPCGVAGLGALPHLTFKLYEDNLDNALMQMGKRLSENPAKITGIYPRKGTIKIGSDADFSVLEIGKSEKNIQSSISDVYETYENFKTNLNFKYVFLNGVPVVKNDMLINADKMSGKCLIKNY